MKIKFEHIDGTISIYESPTAHFQMNDSSFKVTAPQNSESIDLLEITYVEVDDEKLYTNELFYYKQYKNTMQTLLKENPELDVFKKDFEEVVLELKWARDENKHDLIEDFRHTVKAFCDYGALMFPEQYGEFPYDRI